MGQSGTGANIAQGLVAGAVDPVSLGVGVATGGMGGAALGVGHLGRALLISDHGVKAVGLLDNQALQFLRAAPAFLDVPTNPTEAAVRQALVLYRQHNCDGVVAIGGGSPIDLAKGVALLATHSGDLEQYAAILSGIAKITSAVAPLVAVPTTAGTGSEVGRAALITLQDGRKLGFISPFLIPRRAICDPQLTLGLPPFLTAATGFDALSHCIETYLSPRYNPPAEAIAVDGFAGLWNALPKAFPNGSDLEARSEVMMGALQDDPARAGPILARTPMARWGTPEDLQGLALFLTSPHASFITGTIIPVDGDYAIS